MTPLGLTLVFGGRTHLGHCLDEIFASEQLFNHTYALDSLVFTKHKAVLASSDATHRPRKVVTEHRFRLHTPALHAIFLQFMKSFSWRVIFECMDAASTFLSFYTTINELLDRFYPFKTISTSSRDPPFVTPEIKYLLRRKNKLQRSGNLETAACLATRIGRKIASSNASSFSKPCSGPKDL